MLDCVHTMWSGWCLATLVIFQGDLFVSLFCTFSNSHHYFLGMVPHSTSQHVSYKHYLSITKINHNTYPNVLFILAAGVVNNVKWREFWGAYADSDHTGLTCNELTRVLWRLQSTNTAGRWFRHTIGLDPCKAYCFGTQRVRRILTQS